VGVDFIYTMYILVGRGERIGGTTLCLSKKYL
jgi:hypothetical protein